MDASDLDERALPVGLAHEVSEIEVVVCMLLGSPHEVRAPPVQPPLQLLLPSAFGFRVSGFGFRVSGFGFRVSSFEFRVSGFGFGFRVSGFGLRASGFGRRAPFGLRMSGLGSRVSSSGVSGFGVGLGALSALRTAPLPAGR